MMIAPMNNLHKRLLTALALLMLALSVTAGGCSTKKTAVQAGTQGSGPPPSPTTTVTPMYKGPAGPMTEGTTPARVFWLRGIQVQYSSAPTSVPTLSYQQGLTF